MTHVSTPHSPARPVDRLTVVVGISGGIAAYKAVGVVRELVLLGHDVHVVPTEAALRFVGAPTLEAISRNPVHTSVFDDVAEVRHVALGQQADLIVVAPATAHTLATIAHGLSADLLGTTILASTAPLVVAPAMHSDMWRNAATVANVDLLRSRGITIVGPDDGALTGGDVGPGRMSEPSAIVAAALAAVRETGRDAEEARVGDLDGLRLVVSAGGTREPLDPVRFLGNRSSGKQGAAVALAAADRGADVTMVAADIDGVVRESVAGHPRITLVDVGTAEELESAMRAEAAEARVVVMAAAVADYRPVRVSQEKIKKDDSDDGLVVTLVRNPDVLRGLVQSRPPRQLIVGFAAETAPDRADLLERGRAKQRRKGTDLLVLNDVGWTTGFGVDDTGVVIIDAAGQVIREVAGTKRRVADELLDDVVTRLAWGGADHGAAERSPDAQGDAVLPGRKDDA